MAKTYSQINQDINVIDFYDYKKDFYFIDIGAYDGESLSNTLLLEEDYNWKGICVEPLPDTFNKLKKKRNCICINTALYSESNIELDFINAEMLSGVTKNIDCHTHVLNSKNDTIKIKTTTINELLDKNNLPFFIHYMSLDTEGSEYEILKVLNFDKYIFGYINVEHNYIEPRRTQIKNLLLSNGYIYRGENKFDDDYIHKNLIIGVYYFNNNYDNPIYLFMTDNHINVKSKYWSDDEGIFDSNNLTIQFNKLGKGKIYFNKIDFGNNNIWHRNYKYDINPYNNLYDYKYNEYFCKFFINENLNNNKGLTFEQRFIDIISDPNNLLINRVEDAGNIIDNNRILHNGIKVKPYGYCGEFSKILEINKGCHEPGEERMFELVLKYINDGATMIELGSYWAFYTIWFNMTIKNAKNYCIEPEQDGLEIGIFNCKLNNITADFTKGFISNDNSNINLLNFIKNKNIDTIDILHSDIQGYEYTMLNQISELLERKKIKFLFISTHSNNLHHQCLSLLIKYKYKIIANNDHDNETFCFDGIIVACANQTIEIPYIYLGNRTKTKNRNNMFYQL
jgi:FkbM family methyltransferase